MHATWLRGVSDLLDWVLGDRVTSPLGQQMVGLPTVHDLEYEELQADDVASQGLPGGVIVDPAAYPPLQYAETIQASIRWLRGEATISTVELAEYSLNFFSKGRSRINQWRSRFLVPKSVYILLRTAQPYRRIGFHGRSDHQ